MSPLCGEQSQLAPALSSCFESGAFHVCIEAKGQGYKQRVIFAGKVALEHK